MSNVLVATAIREQRNQQCWLWFATTGRGDRSLSQLYNAGRVIDLTGVRPAVRPSHYRWRS